MQMRAALKGLAMPIAANSFGGKQKRVSAVRDYCSLENTILSKI
jgi:hypothetical protein